MPLYYAQSKCQGPYNGLQGLDDTAPLPPSIALTLLLLPSAFFTFLYLTSNTPEMLLL